MQIAEQVGYAGCQRCEVHCMGRNIHTRQEAEVSIKVYWLRNTRYRPAINDVISQVPVIFQTGACLCLIAYLGLRP